MTSDPMAVHVKIAPAGALDLAPPPRRCRTSPRVPCARSRLPRCPGPVDSREMSDPPSNFEHVSGAGWTYHRTRVRMVSQRSRTVASRPPGPPCAARRGGGKRLAWPRLRPSVAPALSEWAAFFAAGAAKRAAAEAGLPRAVSAREADDLLRDSETFLGLVEEVLGVLAA